MYLGVIKDRIVSVACDNLPANVALVEVVYFGETVITVTIAPVPPAGATVVL